MDFFDPPTPGREVIIESPLGAALLFNFIPVG